MGAGSETSSEQLWTIDELIRRRASQLADSPLLCYPRTGLLDYEEHSASRINDYIDTAVSKLQQQGYLPVDAALEQAPVIGILAHSGLHFIITLLALSRLGYASLLLSTRLSGIAIGRLLDLSNCHTVLTTSQFHLVLAEARDERQLRIGSMLNHEDYYGIQAPKFTRNYDGPKENLKQAVIIHSSGSTGLPKPIYLTHRSCLAAFETHLDRKALMTQPLFHSFGFYETFRSIYSGKPMYYYNYSLPITSQNLIDVVEHVKPDLMFCVPYILKLLGETRNGIRSLASIDLIMYGGSACPDDLGDALVNNGVNVAANYGATETGRLMTSVRPPGDKAWNYLRILPQVEPYVLMKDIGHGIYECVALDGLRSKNTINSQNPPNSFHTKDLFTPHPVQRHWWKFASRLDDRLTLVNGEKVLPIPIEGRIRQETLVKEAVVFGDGKTVPGILIVRSDLDTHVSEEEYLAAIWPAIEDANARAESFSRIPRELVLVMPANTIYPKTDKGTFIRAQVYAEFGTQIEKLYEKFESNSYAGSLALSPQKLEDYLIERFRTQCGIDIPSSDIDFFTFGIDSLQCLKMWSVIKKELDLGGKQSSLGQNILYETGTITNLSRHLYGLRVGSEEGTSDYKAIMYDLIKKYSVIKSFDHHKHTDKEARKEVVILTGVTGGLGAHLLAQLVRQPNVHEVWCFVRASSESLALQRTLNSLHSRAIELAPQEMSKVIAISADLSDAQFGLESSKFDELRSKLTLVIHSAWAVNFNISVQSFEDQHIKAVHSFLNLCQSTTHGSPGRFFFCSSVSAAAATPKPGKVLEKQVDEIAHVQHTGYARSKFVAEHIVHNAAKNFGANARVLRIGQLAGDTLVGEWNTTEGIPLMIQTAVTLGALPELNEEMSWLPVNVAASAILDLSLKSTDCTRDPDLVYHILNPTRFHWARQMLPTLAAAGLDFQTLSTADWMQRLRDSDQNPVNNPPVKLLDWFESKYGNTSPPAPAGVLEYLTDQSRKDSHALNNVPSVTEPSYVSKIVARFQKHWNSAP